MDTTSFISTLTQAKQGNTQAQELLIHKFLPLIRKYAMRINVMQWNLKMHSRNLFLPF